MQAPTNALLRLGTVFFDNCLQNNQIPSKYYTSIDPINKDSSIDLGRRILLF